MLTGCPLDTGKPTGLPHTRSIRCWLQSTTLDGRCLASRTNERPLLQALMNSQSQSPHGRHCYLRSWHAASSLQTIPPRREIYAPKCSVGFSLRVDRCVCTDTSLVCSSFHCLRMSNFFNQTNLDQIQAMALIGHCLRNNLDTNSAWILMGDHHVTAV